VPIRIRPYRQNVLFFVGPTGAGKTTTLVKLAGMLALEHKLRVGFVNMDTYRVGAMEHLRIYADIMNIPVHTAYSAADLTLALSQMADRDVVLVDTAGKATGDEGYRQELAEWVKTARADEVFLVLSVATGHRALREIVRNYAFLPDYKLIMTKLDEVDAWGSVLHIRELAGKPLAYVTVGQNVPDDIRPVDTKRIADNIVGRKVSAL
jgi:flagellar biosynthesis protein FlhF